MSGKHFMTAETIVEQIDSSTVDEEGKRRFGHHYGMNLFLQSAFFRMTLVGTSTVVAVTSIAFLAIGVCAVSKTDPSNGNEDRVLIAGGVILLIASFFQFITVAVLSGWCSSTWLSARSYDREIHLLPPNHFLINGQMVNVKSPPSMAGDSSTLIPCSGFELLEPNLQVIPEEDSEQFSRAVPVWSERQHQEVVPVLEVAGRNTGVAGDSTKVDATTCTRGEMVYFPVRGYAPLALQEEMTPSLRSSFQSFDELA